MNLKRLKKAAACAATIALTACSCITAFAAPVIEVSNTAPKNGETITVKVSMQSSANGLEGDITTSSNLTYKSVAPTGGLFSPTANKVLLLRGVVDYAEYTYTVNGAAGEKITFSLSNIIESDASGNPIAQQSATASAPAITIAAPQTAATTQATTATTQAPATQAAAQTTPTTQDYGRFASGSSSVASGAQNVIVPSATTKAGESKSPKTDGSSIPWGYAIGGMFVLAAITLVASKKAFARK